MTAPEDAVITLVSRYALHTLVARDARQPLSEDALVAWGRALGAALPRPAAVALSGEMGAGKTTLARAICAGVGVVDLSVVTSPTFALIHEYEARADRVTHVDLYRLRSANELDALGWDELVASASVLLVEWPERAEQSLPASTIAITVSHTSPPGDQRLLTMQLPLAWQATRL